MTLGDLAMYCGAAFGSGVAAGYIYRKIMSIYEDLGR